MSASIDAGESLTKLVCRKPAAFEWVNRSDHGMLVRKHSLIGENGNSLGQVEGIDMSAFPIPKLRCTEPGFAPDLIFWGVFFVSIRLVEMLDLPPAAVQLLEVDCSECPPEMQAAGYRVLNLLAFANPMDFERSEPADFVHFIRADGRTDHIWLFGGAGPNDLPPRIVWREDFVAPAPVFRMPSSSWTLATDDIAARVTAGGFPSVAFYDPTGQTGSYVLPSG